MAKIKTNSDTTVHEMWAEIEEYNPQQLIVHHCLTKGSIAVLSVIVEKRLSIDQVSGMLDGMKSSIAITEALAKQQGVFLPLA